MSHYKKDSWSEVLDGLYWRFIDKNRNFFSKNYRMSMMVSLFDKMDKDLIKISLPVISNFAINPLIGAVDLFWVNRMGNALAVAGQAAANQVFSSAFWFTSFLPSGTWHDGLFFCFCSFFFPSCS